MPDNFFYDAINLFKFSPTGLGRPQMGGDAAHRNRYITLARQVTERLWYLWAHDLIQYVSLNPSNDAESAPVSATNLSAQWIHISPTYRGNLAATSLMMVHETAHLVTDWHYLIEEILCRNLEALYFQDLLTPQTHHMRSNSGNVQTVQLTLTTAPSDEAAVYQRWLRSQVLDYVLETAGSIYGIATFNGDPNFNAAWVRQAINWWGGLANRSATSKGYFVRALAQGGGFSDAELIVRILESIDRSSCADWQAMQGVVGSWEPTRRILSRAVAIPGHALGPRALALEDYWGVELAVPLGSRRPRCP